MTEKKTLYVIGFNKENTIKAMKHITPDYNCKSDTVRAQIKFNTQEELNKACKFLQGFNMNAKGHKEQIYYNYVE